VGSSACTVRLVRDGSAVTSYAQEALPDGALDDVLAQIAWPDNVVGCAVSQEIVVLPPSAEAGCPTTRSRRAQPITPSVAKPGSWLQCCGGTSAPQSAAARRERGRTSSPGTDLAPNLARALRATFD